MTRKSFVIAIAASSASLALAGCGSSGCFDNQNSLPLAGFYAMSTKEPVGISNVTVYGADVPDGATLLDGASATTLYLPFRPGHDETAFVFHFISEFDEEDKPEPLFNDTIFFTYTTTPHFASDDCGAVYYYHITEMSHTDLFIDSVAITDSTVTNIDKQRIEIYFHDQEEEETPQQPNDEATPPAEPESEEPQK